MFVQGYVTGFCVCVIRVVMERHKATTRNGVPQGKGRARYISTRTDTVVRFAPEYVVLFLGLWNLGSRGCHKAATRNGIPWRIERR